ncbi:MAG: lysophospholipid acyltransferase family protein [Longimicrobiales bacterium]|nr:lysophospholipid acyltransferase family protein [Longimicrobiales bacterium]
MRTLYSYLLWAVIGVLAIAWLPVLAMIFVLTAPFDPGRYAAGRWFRRSAVAAVKLIPSWDFSTEGVVIEDPRRPYVAVANHESLADIFLLSHLPWEMKWLSKEAVFRIPIMGWMMRMAGDIAVRRGDRGSRAEALEQIHDRLDKGVTVMILPEGTRSPDGRLQRFRNGAFRVAVQRQLPILPIAVAGTRDAMAKHSPVFHRARAIARVLEPEETVGLTLDDVPALRDRVRDRIRAARDELRARLE